MPVPFNIVFNPLPEYYFVPPFRAADVTYSFRKGTIKYFCCERHAQSSILTETYPVKPGLFRSEDGETWELLDEFNTIETTGDLGPTWDCRYAAGFSGGPGNLAIFYDSARIFDIHTGYSYNGNIAVFNFETLTWGAPSASLPVLDSTAVARPLFSSRPDGKYVVIINTTTGVQMAVYDGGWSVLTQIIASDFALSLVVDSDNKSHIITDAGKHYVVDVAGSTSGPYTVGAYPHGPLRIAEGRLVFPGMTLTQFVIASADLDAPVWSNQVLSVTPLPHNNQRTATALLALEDPVGVDIGLHFESNSDGTFSVAGQFSRTPLSPDLVVYWIDGTRNHVYRWDGVSAPEIVLTTDEPLLISLSIGTNVTGGGGPTGPVNRYYGW